jgi:hypothetical protein
MRLHTFGLFYVTVKWRFVFNIAVRTSTLCEKNWRYQIRKASEQTTYCIEEFPIIYLTWRENIELGDICN